MTRNDMVKLFTLRIKELEETRYGNDQLRKKNIELNKLLLKIVTAPMVNQRYWQ